MKNENMLIEVPLPVCLIFPYTRRHHSCMLFQLAAAFNVEELSLFGVSLDKVYGRR